MTSKLSKTTSILTLPKNIVELTPGELGEQAQLVKTYNVAVSMAQLLERDASEMHEVTQLETLLDCVATCAKPLCKKINIKLRNKAMIQEVFTRRVVCPVELCSNAD